MLINLLSWASKNLSAADLARVEMIGGKPVVVMLSSPHPIHLSEHPFIAGRISPVTIQFTTPALSAIIRL